MEKCGGGKVMVVSVGLKGLGLKRGVEKSGVEMSSIHMNTTPLLQNSCFKHMQLQIQS